MCPRGGSWARRKPSRCPSRWWPGFALWRLLVPGPLALALTLPVLLSYSLPEKAYEIVALAVLTPWVLATFGQPPRGRRLHWLPGRPDRRSQHRAVLGVHHVRGLGNRGADRAHLAGEPAARPVRPSRRADGGGGRGRRLLVPRAVSRLGAAASVEAGRRSVPGGRDLRQPAALPGHDPAGSARADRPRWPGVVARPGVVGEAAAAADRQRLRLLADMPGALQRERAHCPPAGHAAGDRAAAGGGRGAVHRAGKPGHRPPIGRRDRARPACRRSPCACSPCGRR